MKEIGKLAGVSQSAVSMIVNGRAKDFNLSTETVERVLKIAQENSYRPNLIARSMRTGRTGIVGILASAEWMQQTASNFGNGGVAMQLQAGFLLADCRVMLEIVSNEDCRFLKMPELMQSGLAEFIIVAGTFNDEKSGGRYLEVLNERFKKVVLVDDVIEGSRVPSVTIDNIQAGRDAADYLWKLGHRSFGSISNAVCRIAHRLRLEAFSGRIAELSDGQIGVISAFAGDRWNPDCGNVAVSRLLEMTENRLPSAIFATNDFFAYGAELELLSRGINIPDDTALVGVGEWQPATLAPVPITTISIDTAEKIDRVLHIWKQYQINEKLEQSSFRLKGKLIERQST